MIFMGKDREAHMFQALIRAKIKQGLYAIANQHNYFTAIQPAFRYCQHGRAVCLCHVKV